METGSSIFQAIFALLLVVGLIYLVAALAKRFAFGRLNVGFRQAGGKQKQLVLEETLWLDARYRVVRLKDGAVSHTLLLGPERAIELGAGELHNGPKQPQPDVTDDKILQA